MEQQLVTNPQRHLFWEDIMNNKIYYHIKSKNFLVFWISLHKIAISQGELLILGKYIPHGTAPNKYGAPRWTCLVRAGL